MNRFRVIQKMHLFNFIPCLNQELCKSQLRIRSPPHETCSQIKSRTHFANYLHIIAHPYQPSLFAKTRTNTGFIAFLDILGIGSNCRQHNASAAKGRDSRKGRLPRSTKQCEDVKIIEDCHCLHCLLSLSFVSFWFP